MPHKIVINTCYGGFGISEAAANELGLDQWEHPDRDNLALIALIEAKGSLYVSGQFAQLEIVLIKEKYYLINDYDGMETIYASDSEITVY